MNAIELSMRQALREAQRRQPGPATGWFVYKGVVFASDADADHAPKNDPSLSPEQVDQVREEVRAALASRS